jgi:peptidyl-prolyl cis-trans isomerase B (cyclophilin B)
MPRDFAAFLWNKFRMRFSGKWLTLMGMSLALSLTGAEGLGTAQNKATTKEGKSSVSTNEVAVIKTTLSEMVLEFWPDVAPSTVENFKKLANKGFYDGTAFHRVIKSFMIQGGDPKTKDASKEGEWGTGDPGYKIKAEFNDRKHQKGVISMARSASPDSAGSQFFLVHGDASFLDRKYTAFGKLIKGEDVLDKIANVPCKMVPGGDSQPSRPVTRVGVENIKIVPAESVK